MPKYRNTLSVPKLWHIKFRRQGITQKKANNIQNTAKVWNEGCTRSSKQEENYVSEELFTVSLLNDNALTVQDVNC